MNVEPQRSKYTSYKGWVAVISWVGNGSWCIFPTLQESQKNKLEGEQETPILFNNWYKGHIIKILMQEYPSPHTLTWFSNYLIYWMILHKFMTLGKLT